MKIVSFSLKGLFVTALACVAMTAAAQQATPGGQPVLNLANFKATEKFLKSRAVKLKKESHIFLENTFADVRQRHLPLATGSNMMLGSTHPSTYATMYAKPKNYLVPLAKGSVLLFVSDDDNLPNDVIHELKSVGSDLATSEDFIRYPPSPDFLVKMGFSGAIWSDQTHVRGASCPSNKYFNFLILDLKMIDFARGDLIDDYLSPPPSGLHQRPAYFLNGSGTVQQQMDASTWAAQNLLGCGTKNKEGQDIKLKSAQDKKTKKSKVLDDDGVNESGEPKTPTVWSNEDKGKIKILISALAATVHNAAYEIPIFTETDYNNNSVTDATNNYLATFEEARQKFKKGDESEYRTLQYTRLSEMSPRYGFLAQIPVGAHVLILNENGGWQAAASDLECGALFDSSSSKRCNDLAKLIIQKLKISAVQTSVTDTLLPGTNCKLISGSYSVIDDKIVKSGHVTDVSAQVDELLQHQAAASEDDPDHVTEDQKWLVSHHYAECKPVQHFDLSDLKRDFGAVYDEVLKQTEELSRDTTVFHWQDRHKILYRDLNVTDPQDKQVLQYLTTMTRRFWKNPEDGGSAGGGLYFAFDPRSTMSYGDTLVKVVLKKGSRSLHYFGDSAISAEAVKELKKVECDATTVHALFYSGTLACTSIAKAFAKALRVGFVRYHYRADLNEVCSNTDKLQFAITVFDPSVFDTAQTMVLSRAGRGNLITASQSKEAALIGGMINSNWRTSNIFSLPQESSSSVSNREVLDWAGQHIYGCEAK